MDRINTHSFTILRSRYDAVIFDLDGVVTRTAGMHAAAWKKLFDQYLKEGFEDFKPFDMDDYYRYVDGKPRYDGVKSFLEARGIEISYGKPDDSSDTETICGLGNKKNQIFLECLKEEGVEVYQSSIDLIKKLKDKDFKTAIVSSSKNCAEVLDAANISDLFSVKVDGVDAESLDLNGKPDPDIFVEASHRLEVNPKRCVVLEDAISGVKAGSRGGFGLVVGVNRGKQEKALKDGGADLVVNDLSEIEIEVKIDDLLDGLEHFKQIEQQVKDKKVVVFLDYDGTLTPIVAHPEDAVLSEDMRKTLVMLSDQCTVAVISGRDLKDVKGRVGIDGIYYAGSHGFEIEGPEYLKMEYEKAGGFLPLLDEAEESLKQQLAHIDGCQVERKKFSIAVHYRNVKDRDVKFIEEVVNQAALHYTKLRQSYGKKVYELQPNVNWDKGKALLWILDATELAQPDTIPFYIGDDLTDEDAFAVLQMQGIGVVVGEGSRYTSAKYRLKNPAQVEVFLHTLTTILEEGNGWSLIYKDFDSEEEGLREALCTLGNGYFASRGASPESDADDIHYPGTYLAGGYNRLETSIDGSTIENEDLVNLPNWLCLNFRIPGEDWFNLTNVNILSYRQELDLKKGILYRTVHFQDKNNRQTRLLNRSLVHMGDMHIAAIETVIIPVNWSGKIEICSALNGQVTNSGVKRYKNLNNKHLLHVEAKQIDDNTILLQMRTNQSKLNISEASRTQVFKDESPVIMERLLVEKPAYIAQHFTVELTEGKRLSIEKVVSLFNSRDAATSECTLESEKAVLDAPRFNGLLQTHTTAWKHLWHSFEINLGLNSSNNGHPIQGILRLYIFHLLESASMHSLDIDVGMPSRGWHGEAYRGHIFWDELIIFPFLIYRVPQIARTLLMYRYRRLKEARKAAYKLGYKGAMYPWQSGSNGREESQRVHLNPVSGHWVRDNTHLQRHINAAIVYNVWQYYQVTCDLEFLSFYGAEIILEIARFWASIATYNKKLDRYEILGVVGPDEYHDSYPGAKSPGVNNNAYTNVMAVFVLNRAIKLFELLPEQQWKELCERLDINEAEKVRWKEISRKMLVVFHDDGIISQFEGYEHLDELNWERYHKKYGNIQRLDRILEAEGDTTNRYKVSKQADVLMLFYLFSSEELSQLFGQLGYSFEYETIPKNIDYYLKRTSNGSSLSWIIHSWVAARRDRKRSWELFNQALKTDVADIQGGTTPEGIHLGAMSGCVDMVQRCYTGLECRGNILRFNPVLPGELKRISLHLHYRGHWFDLNITADKLKIESLPGGAKPIWVEVKGNFFELAAGETKEVALKDSTVMTI